MIQVVHWIIPGVSASLCLSSVLRLVDTWEQSTSIGLPQSLYVFPLVFGSAFMTLFGIANAGNGPGRQVRATLIGCVVAALMVYGWNLVLPSHAILHALLLAVGFVGGLATAFFSGVSGSKLADIAAVGGIVMPAARRTEQDPNEPAGLHGRDGRDDPPCINMIIMGFVANISIAGLFMARLIPVAELALSLAVIAVIVGKKINPDDAFDKRTAMLPLIGGALVALLMVGMIGKGVTSGVATTTEVSAFAVVHAMVVGGLAFRELSMASVARLSVRSASMAGSILFIVVAASSVSFALTIEQIPQMVSGWMIAFAQDYGSTRASRCAMRPGLW